MPTQVVFITGASSGIGYAAALAFARQGTHVAAIARRSDRLKALASAIHALSEPHGQILAMAADVQDAEGLQAAVDMTVTRFGRLDVLVANAGVGHRGALADADWDDVETLLRTNIDGVLHSIRAAVPAMRRNGGGHIIVVSSVVANMTAPHTALYAASKAFVSSLAASLRLELADDQITITDLRLGRAQTEFNEKRLGKSGRARTFGPSVMPAERVAKAIVRAAERKPKLLTLRLIDRLTMLANTLVPGLIARMVAKQYKE